MSGRMAHILNAVYCEPWLIRPEMHDKIDQIVMAHYTGEAHEAAGIATIFGNDEEDTPIRQDVGNVAVISMSGVMGKRVSALQQSSGVVDVDVVGAAVSEAITDKSVKGIVLDIDSPGGSALGTPELADVIKLGRDTKRIIAFTETSACSGACWVASQAFAFVASESASVGSIGVFLAILDRSEAFKQAGVKQDLIKSGKFKGAGMDGTSLTEEQRANFQAQVNFLHAQFKAAVRAGRGTAISDEVMEGQSFFGSQAVGLGLVDVIGNLQDAIALAQQ